MNFVELDNEFLNLSNVVSFSMKKNDIPLPEEEDIEENRVEGEYRLSVSTLGNFHNSYYGLDAEAANEIWNLLRKETKAVLIR
ncbi:hypothetical protein AK824_13315 (plasmid) [Psychrobacter sp. P11G3]|nr:hypothetical protein AK824_13315 [Psychrobacter sp. P11G3]